MSVKWFRDIASNIVSMLTPPLDTVVRFVLPRMRRLLAPDVQAFVHERYVTAPALLNGRFEFRVRSWSTSTW
jgi:hypothetical protein